MCPQLLDSEPGGPHQLGSATVLNKPTKETRGSDKQRKRATEFNPLTRDDSGAVVVGMEGWVEQWGTGWEGWVE